MIPYLKKSRLTKTQALEVLKRFIPVKPIILDIGVLTGTYELITAFSNSHHILFEPVESHAQAIHYNYNKFNISHELVLAAVSNKSGFVNIDKWTVYSENEISHAVMNFENKAINKPQIDDAVKMITLDQYLESHSNESPYVLKIDIDGYEHLVLEGAIKTLNNTVAVIVEARPANFFAITQLMLSSSFCLFDIVDFCYFENRLAQFDLIFISSRIARENHIYKDGFDIKKWNYYPRDIID